MKQKLTPWFPADVKPVYVGWYQCQFHQQIPLWRYWDGQDWLMSYGEDKCNDECFVDLTPDKELISSFGDCPYESGESWRGLAEKPE